MKKGTKMTLESRLKLSQAHSGKRLSQEHKEKIGLSLKGKEKSQETKRNMSEAQKGKVYSVETRQKISETLKKNPVRYWLGKKSGPRPLAVRMKISQSTKGEKSHNWKGGISSKNNIIRHSIEYKDWRTSVFERDNFTCVECGSRGVTLQADHIKPFAYFPELRLVIDNGRTLCVPCHKKTDTFAGRARVKYEFNNYLTL